MAYTTRGGRSQRNKGKKGAMRPKNGNKPGARRSQQLAARKRKVREREALESTRAYRAAKYGKDAAAETASGDAS